ncbi:hypothetical protein MKK65_08025 [Methylobacterium sp. J-001]|nr:hypothetical protein [Methylobacterium sp. J-001]MCJ2116527.1 hypothetical protein [Methylobacterium sp. J-001]
MVIEAPAVVPEMSKVPALATPLELAIEPVPDRASVLFAAIEVEPV